MLKLVTLKMIFIIGKIEINQPKKEKKELNISSYPKPQPVETKIEIVRSDKSFPKTKTETKPFNIQKTEEKTITNKFQVKKKI